MFLQIRAITSTPKTSTPITSTPKTSTPITSTPNKSRRFGSRHFGNRRFEIRRYGTTLFLPTSRLFAFKNYVIIIVIVLSLHTIVFYLFTQYFKRVTHLA